MRAGSFSGFMKGQGSGGAVAVIIIIAIVAFVIIAFPQVFSGLGLNFFNTAGPIGVGPGTAGVVITSFIASPPIIEGGDSATFTLNVQNKGGIDADGIKYDIFGIGDSNSWSGKSTSQSGTSSLTFEDASRQIPGEETTQEWESEAKEKNTDITYPVTARVEYDYKTEASLLLLLYGRDNPNVKNTGITQSTIGQISTTSGPLAVTPKGTIPLIGKNTDDFRVTFDIVNIGGGRTFRGSKSTGLDKIRINAEGCTLSGESEIKLIEKKKTVSCKVDPTISTDGQETKSVTLEIEYSYIVESTANVKVLKQAEQ